MQPSVYSHKSWQSFGPPLNGSIGGCTLAPLYFSPHSKHAMEKKYCRIIGKKHTIYIGKTPVFSQLSWKMWISLNLPLSHCVTKKSWSSSEVPRFNIPKKKRRVKDLIFRMWFANVSYAQNNVCLRTPILSNWAFALLF